MLHKAPADFSTASGENSGADGANSRQNQGVSIVPTGRASITAEQPHSPAGVPGLGSLPAARSAAAGRCAGAWL